MSIMCIKERQPSGQLCALSFLVITTANIVCAATTAPIKLINGGACQVTEEDGTPIAIGIPGAIPSSSVMGFGQNLYLQIDFPNSNVHWRIGIVDDIKGILIVANQARSRRF